MASYTTHGAIHQGGGEGSLLEGSSSSSNKRPRRTNSSSYKCMNSKCPVHLSTSGATLWMLRENGNGAYISGGLYCSDCQRGDPVAQGWKAQHSNVSAEYAPITYGKLSTKGGPPSTGASAPQLAATVAVANIATESPAPSPVGEVLKVDRGEKTPSESNVQEKVEKILNAGFILRTNSGKIWFKNAGGVGWEELYYMRGEQRKRYTQRDLKYDYNDQGYISVELVNSVDSGVSEAIHDRFSQN